MRRGMSVLLGMPVGKFCTNRGLREVVYPIRKWDCHPLLQPRFPINNGGSEQIIKSILGLSLMGYPHGREVNKDIGPLGGTRFGCLRTRPSFFSQRSPVPLVLCTCCRFAVSLTPPVLPFFFWLRSALFPRRPGVICRWPAFRLLHAGIVSSSCPCFSFSRSLVLSLCRCVAAASRVPLLLLIVLPVLLLLALLLAYHSITAALVSPRPKQDMPDVSRMVCQSVKGRG
ncbi:hypothetical protein BX666DRAFT_988256 [Dichotomocladium elegans]|nr:hypothetical protein BX666DRAFT_988256 [Dichotomocladium elegans]